MAIRSYKNILPKLGARVYVDEQAAVIGDVIIGDDSSIWPMCSVRGDVNSIHIGARTNIQDGTVIHVTHRHEGVPEGANRASLPRTPRLDPLGEGRVTIIGDDVTVGHLCILHACTVENYCLIGMGSVVMDDAILHEGLILGAGSLVTEGKELEGGYLWLGRPAKRMRELTAEEKAWLEYSAKHYAKLKDDYLAR